MASLHDAVDSTKKILLFGVIGIVVIVMAYLLFQGGVALKNTFFPEPVPEPTEDFGELPDIVFPPDATTRPLTYSLDTITGNLPEDYPDRLLVYEITKAEPTLQDIQVAKEKVRNISFVTKEKELSPTTFEWTNLKTYSRTITMDVVSGNFYFSTDFMTNPAFLESKKIINETAALKEAENFFTDLSSFPDDIDEDLTKTQGFTIENGKQVEAVGENETRIMRVDYFQTPIADEVDEEITYPVHYPKPNQSLINALVAAGEATTVVEAHYTHHTISENVGEYYIKPPDIALEELKNDEGYIASYFGNDTEIKIQEVYLAYYLGEEEQPYLQPIWVFTNSINGFYAYVAAIDDYWNDPPPPVTPEE